MLNKDSSKVTLNEWDQMVMDPLTTGCGVMKRFGGWYHEDCHVFDGHKYVCLDHYSKHDVS